MVALTNQHIIAGSFEAQQLSGLAWIEDQKRAAQQCFEELVQKLFKQSQNEEKLQELDKIRQTQQQKNVALSLAREADQISQNELPILIQQFIDSLMAFTGKPEDLVALIGSFKRFAHSMGIAEANVDRLIDTITEEAHNAMATTPDFITANDMPEPSAPPIEEVMPNAPLESVVPSAPLEPVNTLPAPQPGVAHAKELKHDELFGLLKLNLSFKNQSFMRDIVEVLKRAIYFGVAESRPQAKGLASYFSGPQALFGFQNPSILNKPFVVGYQHPKHR